MKLILNTIKSTIKKTHFFKIINKAFDDIVEKYMIYEQHFIVRKL